MDNSSSSSSSVKQLLRTSIGVFASSKAPMIEVDEGVPVREALEVMTRSGITSVPVTTRYPDRWLSVGGSLALEGDPEHPRKIIGVVSTFDIVCALGGGDSGASTGSSLLARKISTMIGQSSEGMSLYLVDPSTMLSDALEPFSKGIHRILVRGRGAGGSARFSLVSQTDVARFILQNASSFSVFLGQPISILPGVLVSVTAIPCTVTALQAFRQLRTSGLLAAPVVAADGVIVNTISASDLRGLTLEALAALEHDNVLTFLRAAKWGRRTSKPVSISPNATIGSALATIRAHSVHRAWVCDSSQHVIGVVSISDIISALYRSVTGSTRFPPPSHSHPSEPVDDLE